MQRLLLGIALVAIVSSAAQGAAAAEPVDAVRNDWYFRETLPAIRGWEAILDRSDKAKPPQPATPVFPVPSNGEVVEWPNPIPLLLLPPEDRGLRVRLRVAGDRVEMERREPDAKAKQSRHKPGEVVSVYKHPGGGAKDQWYHAYHRKFDRLTNVALKPAPFAVRLAAPLDLPRGRQELEVWLKNVTDRDLRVDLRLRFDTPKESRDCGGQTLTLAPGASRTTHLPVDLADEGGGLFGLHVQAAAESYWLPLLTHVEDVTSVLTSIEQILADTPDPRGSKSLDCTAEKGSSVDACFSASPAAIRGGRSSRKPAASATGCSSRGSASTRCCSSSASRSSPSSRSWTPTTCSTGRAAASIGSRPVRPDGQVTPVVDSLGEGVYRDVCLHWNAERLLFSFGNGSDHWDKPESYHVYEVARGRLGPAPAHLRAEERLRAVLPARRPDRLHLRPLRALRDVRRRPALARRSSSWRATAPACASSASTCSTTSTRACCPTAASSTAAGSTTSGRSRRCTTRSR